MRTAPNSLNPDLPEQLKRVTVPLVDAHRFFDRQGAVHARVSIDFARELDCLLEIML